MRLLHDVKKQERHFFKVREGPAAVTHADRVTSVVGKAFGKAVDFARGLHVTPRGFDAVISVKSTRQLCLCGDPKTSKVFADCVATYFMRHAMFLRRKRKISLYLPNGSALLRLPTRDLRPIRGTRRRTSARFFRRMRMRDREEGCGPFVRKTTNAVSRISKKESARNVCCNPTGGDIRTRNFPFRRNTSSHMNVLSYRHMRCNVRLI